MVVLLGRYSPNLYLCHVRLVGLATASEAQLRLGPRTARTALPLWFVNFVRCESRVWALRRCLYRYSSLRCCIWAVLFSLHRAS